MILNRNFSNGTHAEDPFLFDEFDQEFWNVPACQYVYDLCLILFSDRLVDFRLRLVDGVSDLLDLFGGSPLKQGVLNSLLKERRFQDRSLHPVN